MSLPANQEARVYALQALEVHGRHAAATIFLKLVLNALLAIEGPHASSFNGRDVDEGVAAAVFGLDEAVTLVGIEELDGAGDPFPVPSAGGPDMGAPRLKEAKEGKRCRKSAVDRSTLRLQRVNL